MKSWGIRHLFAIVVSAVSIQFCVSALGCGINWDAPKGTFDGINYLGNAYLVQSLGSLDFDSIKAPIYLTFDSGSRTQSSYVSLGFELPLLESHIVQTDENNFLMTTPSGWIWPFVRSKEPSILDGAAGWKAEIKGNTITAWSDCGDKMVFNKGKLTELQIKETKISYTYTDEHVDEIRKNGKTLLKVNYNVEKSRINELVLGSGQTIRFDFGNRPRIQSINGKNLVTGMVESLSAVHLSDNSVKTFEFSVDGNLKPTLRVNQAQSIIWDPTDNRLISYGDWRYSFQAATPPNSEVRVARTNSKNETQVQIENAASGLSITKNIDGSTITKTRFTSGNLAGKLRDAKVTLNDQTIFSRTLSYDELSRVIRDKIEQKGVISEINLTYDTDGQVTRTCLLNGKLLWSQKGDVNFSKVEIPIQK